MRGRSSDLKLGRGERREEKREREREQNGEERSAGDITTTGPVIRV